jgi:hypothetical protein
MRLALCIWLVYIGGQLSWRGITGPDDAKAPVDAVSKQYKNLPAPGIP